MPSASDGSLSPNRGRSVSARRIRYAVGALALLLVTQTAGMLPVFRDSLQRYLGIGDRGFGFLFSIGPAVGLIGVLAGGLLVDRWGPRPVLRLCFLGMSAGLLLIALAGRQWVIVAMALGVRGIFSGPLSIALNVYLLRLFSGSRRRVLSLYLAAVSIGNLVFPVIAEGLLRLARPFAGVTFAMVLHLPMALAALVLLPAGFLYRKRAGLGAAAAPVSRWHWRDMLLPRRFFFLIILLALHGTADTALWVWMARFLGSASFSSRPVAPGFVLSGCAAAYLVGRLALALVPERRGRRALMILPGLVGGGVFIAGILTRNYLCAAAGYVFGSLLWCSEYPVMFSVIAREEPGRFGAAMALQQLVSIPMVLLAVNGMGFLTARLGEACMWKVMLLPACVFPVIGIGAALWVVLYGRHSRPDAGESTCSQGRR